MKTTFMNKILGILLLLGLGLTTKALEPTTDLVTTTVYHAVPGQTDDTPLITASGYNIKGNDRIIAVSRDLLKRYPYGTVVKIKGEKGFPYSGIYTVEDTMHKRFDKRIDILIEVGDPVGAWQNILLTKIN